MNSPGVRFPPPLLYVAGLAIAWLLDTRVRRLAITTEPAMSDVRVMVGWMVVAAGGILIAWGMLTFVRARTAIIPNHAASRIVDSGPYRFTRNPMYVGFTTCFLGIMLLLNSWWPLVILPFCHLALRHLVVAREERYLSEAFGADYKAYQERVRRWL